MIIDWLKQSVFVSKYHAVNKPLLNPWQPNVD